MTTEVKVTEADYQLAAEILGFKERNPARPNSPFDKRRHKELAETVAKYRLAERERSQRHHQADEATVERVAPVAWLYASDFGDKELLLDCNGEQATRLLELGWTEMPLYAAKPQPAPVDDRPLNTSPVDYHETTDQRTQADDLLERLGDEADLCRNDGANDIADLLDEAAATIKELKAEVESFRGCLATTCGKLMAAEARATKAEEALRVCRDQLSFYDSDTSRL